MMILETGYLVRVRRRSVIFGSVGCSLGVRVAPPEDRQSGKRVFSGSDPVVPDLMSPQSQYGIISTGIG